MDPKVTHHVGAADRSHSAGRPDSRWLWRCAGPQFDPEVVRSLERVVPTSNEFSGRPIVEA